MIGPFRSYIIRGKPQNEYLYKITLSRSQPGDVVYAQTMESFFFIKVLKSPRSYDFLKQIELADIVDMKKFQ